MAAALYKAGSGVGDAGHARIRDHEGDSITFLNTLNDVFAALCFVKLVVTHEWGINLVALSESFGVASVLSTDEIDLLKRFDGAHREVA